MKKLQKEKADVQKQIEDLENAIKTTYFDKAKGILSEKEFVSFRESFEQDLSLLQGRVEEIGKRLETLKGETDKEKSVKAVLGVYRNIKELDRTVVDALIDYVEVGRNDHKVHKTDLPPIIIHWKF